MLPEEQKALRVLTLEEERRLVEAVVSCGTIRQRHTPSSKTPIPRSKPGRPGQVHPVSAYP